MLAISKSLRALGELTAAIQEAVVIVERVNGLEQFEGEHRRRVEALTAERTAAEQARDAALVAVAEAQRTAERIVADATRVAADLDLVAKLERDALAASVAGLVERTKADAAAIAKESAEAKDVADQALAAARAATAAEAEKLAALRATIDKIARA